MIQMSKQKNAATPETALDVPSNLGRRDVLRQLGTVGAVAAGVGFMSQAVAQNAQATANKDLRGKVAIVTGARNNQGRAYAQALARAGADVVVHYHRAETRDQAEETARLVRAEGQKVALVMGDLGRPEVIRQVFDVAIKELGRADILINCAGAIIKKPLAQLTDEELLRLTNVNVLANFLCVREAARRLADNGRIINIGTSLLAGNAPQYSAYAGTKAPVEEMTRMLPRELGQRRITINTINPGPLDNTFFWAAETPESGKFAANLSVEGRLGKESDVVPLVVFLASPQSQWINGQSIWPNGGYLTR
jgi:NAD(P)-dependent dehydrogenase (short-subunit alcohol dehydrogenase family)